MLIIPWSWRRWGVWCEHSWHFRKLWSLLLKPELKLLPSHRWLDDQWWLLHFFIFCSSMLPAEATKISGCLKLSMFCFLTGALGIYMCEIPSGLADYPLCRPWLEEGSIGQPIWTSTIGWFANEPTALHCALSAKFSVRATRKICSVPTSIKHWRIPVNPCFMMFPCACELDAQEPNTWLVCILHPFVKRTARSPWGLGAMFVHKPNQNAETKPEIWRDLHGKRRRNHRGFCVVLAPCARRRMAIIEWKAACGAELGFLVTVAAWNW